MGDVASVDDVLSWACCATGLRRRGGRDRASFQAEARAEVRAGRGPMSRPVTEGPCVAFRGTRCLTHHQDAALCDQGSATAKGSEPPDWAAYWAEQITGDVWDRPAIETREEFRDALERVLLSLSPLPEKAKGER